MSDSPLIFMVAGEPSGDALGAQLMAALKRLTGGAVRFAGVGGERMAGEGLASLFPLEDLAVMGFAEVAPRLPRILRRLRETEAAARAARPAVVVTIDSPGFTFRLARRLRAPGGAPLVHYVAPQVWAWRPERARRLAGLFDRLMVLFPFEPPFFARYGIAAIDVGHPVIERMAPAASPGTPRGRTLAMLPGSRRGLVRRMLPVYGEAARLLAPTHPGLELLLPVVGGTRDLVAAAGWGVPHRLLANEAAQRAGLAVAAAAVTTSGTATLELAVADVPMVVTYRLNFVTALLARRWITVPHVSMPNLIAGRGLVPELLQPDCTPARVAAEAARLLDDPRAAAAQREGFAEIRRALGAGAGPPPSERAARVVLEAIGR